MLFSAVIFDESFEPASGREELIYNSLIRLLRDIKKAGVVLIDEEEKTIQNLSSYIKRWDEINDFDEGEHCAKEIHRLLRKIIEGGRLIESPFDKSFDPPCESKSCAEYLSIVKSQKPDFVILPQKCFSFNGGSLAVSTESKILKIESFDRCMDFQKYSDRQGFQLNNWNHKDFEHKILSPLFQYTENVFLCDRQMGHYFSSNIGYGVTIAWILDVFMRNSNPSRRGLFEIHIKKASKSTKLDFFEKIMKTKYSGFSIVRNAHSYHDRFLRTDQVEITIGNGFDLFADSDSIWNRHYFGPRQTNPNQDKTLSVDWEQFIVDWTSLKPQPIKNTFIGYRDDSSNPLESNDNVVL